MSLKYLRLLNTFCWHSFGAWGDRMLLIFVFLSSQLQKMSEIHPTPIPFSLGAEVWASASLFLLWFFLKQPCREALGSLFSPHLAQPAHTHASSYSLYSKMWCFPFLGVLYRFCLFVLNCSFPTKIMPRKNKLCMFPAVSSHLRMYHLHLSVFYSLCKNWLI